MRARLSKQVCFGVTLLPVLAWSQEFNLSPTFAGHAETLQVQQAGGNPLTFADTGVIPANGGQRQNYAPGVSVAGVNAHSLSAVTLASGSRNVSRAGLAYLDAKVGSHEVTASWVEAEATATAGFLNTPTTGKSVLAGLVLDGRAVTVTGQANQTISLPDGYLVINEQSGASIKPAGNLTVNALHLVVPRFGSFVAASATAAVINTPTRGTAP